jgi:hypothetical protein
MMFRAVVVFLLMLCLPAAALAQEARLGPSVGRSCKIRWTPPTLNEDLTPVGALEGFEIFISGVQGVYDWDHPMLVVSPKRHNAPCPEAIKQLGGQYYVTIRAVTVSGRPSAPSNEFAFVVDAKHSGKDDDDDDDDGKNRIPQKAPPPARHPLWWFGW